MYESKDEEDQHINLGCCIAGLPGAALTTWGLPALTTWGLPALTTWGLPVLTTWGLPVLAIWGLPVLDGGCCGWGTPATARANCGLLVLDNKNIDN